MEPQALVRVPGTPSDAVHALRRLTPEETQTAQDIARAFDVRDSVAISGFGVAPQKEMSALTDPIMRLVATKETGEAGQSLTELMSHIRELNADSLAGQVESRAARLPLVGAWFTAARRFISRYEKIGVKIDRTLAALETSRSTLGRDVALLDRLYVQNVACIRGLLTWIAAGEMKIDQLHAEHRAVAETATRSEDPIDVQTAADLGNAITRLERRVYDLKLAAEVALQTAPQIRLVQNADQALVEKIQSSILTTVPVWKSQIVIAIGLFNERKAMELQRAVTNTTNAMLRRNAEMLKQATTAAAHESERGIVELETLQAVNQALIETIEETLAIQGEGRRKRNEAEAVLDELQKQRQAKLLDVQRTR